MLKMAEWKKLETVSSHYANKELKKHCCTSFHAATSAITLHTRFKIIWLLMLHQLVYVRRDFPCFMYQRSMYFSDVAQIECVI